jgi:exonuclease SbcC
VTKAAEIEAAYASWQAARVELEHWNEVAATFREHETRRQAPRMEIEAERARLKQELEQLHLAETTVHALEATLAELGAQVDAARQGLEKAEQAISARAELDTELQAARQRQADARAENPRLKGEMDQLKARIDQLSKTEGAACPLCGRPLETHDRMQLIDEITAQGKEMGDRYRENLAYLKEADQKVREIEAHIASLSNAEHERLVQTQMITRIGGQIETIQQKARRYRSRQVLHESSSQWKT